MKVNHIGIVASVIALISLALPWWTMPMSGTIKINTIDETITENVSMDVSVYTYDASMTTRFSLPTEEGVVRYSERIADVFSIWYSYTALALMVIAGVEGIVGSLTVGKDGKILLVVAGILALLSIIIFVAGLQSELPKLSEALEKKTSLSGFPKVGLFSSGSSNSTGTFEETAVVMSYSYSTYLSFGFWLALVAAIIVFISLLKHPVASLPAKTTPKS